jgi:hypothetical protein
MVAQTIAIEHPERARSLTSMFSTSGDPAVGQTDVAAPGSVGAPPQERQGYFDWQARATRAVGSPGFPFDEAAVADTAADRMIDVSGGRATAGAIPGAKLVTFDGMGHNLPRQLWAHLVGHIAELVQRAEAGL